jgi:hypothetical protein
MLRILISSRHAVRRQRPKRCVEVSTLDIADVVRHFYLHITLESGAITSTNSPAYEVRSNLVCSDQSKVSAIISSVDELVLELESRMPMSPAKLGKQ